MRDSEDDYGQTKRDYDEGFEWHSEKSFSYDFSEWVKKFVSMLGGKRLLDAGCGAGRDVQLFLERGLEVVGIDFSRKAIAHCRKKFPAAKFHSSDLRKIPGPNASFDGVWACASLLNLKRTSAS